MSKGVNADSVEILTKAYRLYTEQVQASNLECMLSFTAPGA